MKISRKGLELIKKHEGFSPEKYLCPAGKLTIGYGHVIQRGETFTKLTEKEALALLDQDADIAENTVNNLVKVPLNQNQFDALVSLVYNWGSGHFLRSQILQKINNKDYIGAKMGFLKINKIKGKISHGLTNRRVAEVNLFNESQNA
jgi:lysozyme